jgi:hypothetical protein
VSEEKGGVAGNPNSVARLALTVEHGKVVALERKHTEAPNRTA